MLKLIVGFILGIVVATTGFTFTDAATYLDKGVKYIKESVQQPVAKVEKKVDVKQ